jgi:hypothetical protein
MTSIELAKRQEKALPLKVFQVTDDQFYVENSTGKICYKVNLSGHGKSCTCADFTANGKKDPEFLCKHLIAATNGNGNQQKIGPVAKDTPKLDERFITKIKGKDFVKYPGLLDLGHKMGISKIEVTPLQFPNKENGRFAICQAEVVSKTGEVFKDIGDADPGNCDPLVAKHVLRMASTRAIARALRSFTNIGMTCLEEIDDFDKGTGEKPSKPKRNAKQKKSTKEEKKEKSKPKDESKAKEKVKGGSPENNGTMSPAQQKAIQNLAKRRGINDEELNEMSRKQYSVPLKELPSKDASAFIRHLQQAA